MFFDILYETVPKIGMRFFNNLTKYIRIIINIRSSGKKMFFSNKTIIFYDFFLLFIDAGKSQDVWLLYTEFIQNYGAKEAYLEGVDKVSITSSLPLNHSVICGGVGRVLLKVLFGGIKYSL